MSSQPTQSSLCSFSVLYAVSSTTVISLSFRILTFAFKIKCFLSLLSFSSFPHSLLSPCKCLSNLSFAWPHNGHIFVFLFFLYFDFLSLFSSILLIVTKVLAVPFTSLCTVSKSLLRFCTTASHLGHFIFSLLPFFSFLILYPLFWTASQTSSSLMSLISGKGSSGNFRCQFCSSDHLVRWQSSYHCLFCISLATRSCTWQSLSDLANEFLNKSGMTSKNTE